MEGNGKELIQVGNLGLSLVAMIFNRKCSQHCQKALNPGNGIDDDNNHGIVNMK